MPTDVSINPNIVNNGVGGGVIVVIMSTFRPLFFLFLFFGGFSDAKSKCC